MKITWWGWIIILVVAYWWLKKKGYFKGNANSPPPCANTATCQKCYDCLIESGSVGYEAEQQCNDWNCVGEYNFPD